MSATQAPAAAAGASSVVSVRYLGAGRGFGMVVTRPVKEGEVSSNGSDEVMMDAAECGGCSHTPAC